MEKEKTEEEREYTFSVGHVCRRPKYDRAAKVIRSLKKQVKKNTRKSEENILISKELNEFVWKNGAFTVPRKLNVIIVNKPETATVYLKEGKELKEEKERQKKESQEKKKVKEEKKEEEKAKAEKKELTEAEKEQKRKLEEKREKEKATEKAEFKRK